MSYSYRVKICFYLIMPVCRRGLTRGIPSSKQVKGRLGIDKVRTFIVYKLLALSFFDEPFYTGNQDGLQNIFHPK